MLHKSVVILPALVLTLMLPIGVQAQSHKDAPYSDEQLYAAYQAGDMQTWKEYIDHACFDSLTTQEQTRRVYYEYGYAAALLDIDKRAARPYIRQFGEHIEVLKNDLPPVLLHVYTVAFHTYDMAANARHIKMHCDQILLHAEQAVQADSTHPLAWGIQANVHFYAPRLMGGNKQLAMREYERADSLFEMHAHDHELDWTYMAQTVSLVQCYDKLGLKDKALAKARQAAARWQRFDYMKQYLQELEKKTNNNNH